MRVVIAEDSRPAPRGARADARRRGHEVVAAVGDALGLLDAVERDRPDL